MSEKKYIISNKKTNLPVWAIWFLVFVLVLTTALFFYNNHLDNKNQDTLTRIDNVNSKIKEIEKNPQVQVYSLLEMNKWVIGELEKRNKITDYIRHFSEVWKYYDISFDWFNYNNWNISTTAIAQSNSEWWVASSKTVQFIRDYRLSDTSIFDLNFISSFEWMDVIKYNLNFELK